MEHQFLSASPRPAINNIKVRGSKGVEHSRVVHDFAHQLSVEFKQGRAEGSLHGFAFSAATHTHETDDGLDDDGQRENGLSERSCTNNSLPVASQLPHYSHSIATQ